MIAIASEEVKGGAAVAHKIMLMDGELISPSALTMSRDDILEFENYSGQARHPSRRGVRHLTSLYGVDAGRRPRLYRSRVASDDPDLAG